MRQYVEINKTILTPLVGKEITMKVPTFIKKPQFPWLIIALVSVLFVGVVTGWTLRSNDVARMDSVRATALSEVTTAKK